MICFPVFFLSIFLGISVCQGAAHAEKKATWTLSRFQVRPLYRFDEMVNKDAPKGGHLRLGALGTFNSLNTFARNSQPVYDISLTYDTLMVQSCLEPHVYYGLLAERVYCDDQKIIFFLNPRARFHNGDPVTADDVQKTYQVLSQQGVVPALKPGSVTIHTPHTIEFRYDDPSIPYTLALMPVFSAKQLQAVSFEQSGIIPLLGTGPYKIGAVIPGKTVTFHKNSHYWAKSHLLTQGLYNFNTLTISYYAHPSRLFQGFLSKRFDVFFETNPRQWHTRYPTTPHLTKITLPHERPVPLRVITMNNIQDVNLRQAIIGIFDAKRYNRILFGDDMQVPDTLCPHLIHGNHPQQHIKALQHLTQHHYNIKQGRLYNPTGHPVHLTFLITDEKGEKVALFLKESLKQIGVTLTIQRVDATLYTEKVMAKEYNFIIKIIKTEHNLKADAPKAYDALQQAKTHQAYDQALVDFNHALTQRHIMIPLSCDRTLRVAYWHDKINLPPFHPTHDVDVMRRGWFVETR